MSTRKRALEDDSSEQNIKRQKIEHNEVHPFDLPELVEAIVSHLLKISPLSILNILCLSKRHQEVISSKSFWLRRGFKQLYDAISDDVVPLEYLRAVLGQLELNSLKEEELHWGQESYDLSEERYGRPIDKHVILECKFDLVKEERDRYDARRLDAMEYLSNKYLTYDAHKVLLNVMARTCNKLFSLQQLIEFIEISEPEIKAKQKQKLFDFITVPATEYKEINDLQFDESLIAKAKYYTTKQPNGPVNLYQLMFVDNTSMHCTVFHRVEDFVSPEANLQIWKRFIDDHRSILIIEGFCEVANVTMDSEIAFIKFNSKTNVIEECDFLEIGVDDNLDESEEAPEDGAFLKLIEFPVNEGDNVAQLASQISRQIFGSWERRYIVTKAPPPQKYFKNVKFRRTQRDNDFETNLCKLHKSQPENIFLESVLPYLVNYPKSFLTLTGLCKSFRALRLQQDFWKRLGFVHFAEWNFDYIPERFSIQHIRPLLRAIRREFIRNQVLQLRVQMRRVTKIAQLRPHVVMYVCSNHSNIIIDNHSSALYNKFNQTLQTVQAVLHGVRFQEYLANTKITDEAAQMLMWLKRNIGVEALSLEDLISFIELGRHHPYYPTSEIVTEVNLTVPLEDRDRYLVKIQRGAWGEEDWDFLILMQFQETYTSRLHSLIDSDEVYLRLDVNKVFIDEHRSILFIQSFSKLMSWLSQEHFYIKYDHNKNLIEEFGTLSTFRALNCPNETNFKSVLRLMLECPEQNDGFFETMVVIPEHLAWQTPLPEQHLKNVKFRK